MSSSLLPRPSKGRSGAAMPSRRCCVRSTCRISRSILARAIRGLHDSLVNYIGNERPQMLLCVHEEEAVAIAHGYARVSDRMMGAVLHSQRRASCTRRWRCSTRGATACRCFSSARPVRGTRRSAGRGSTGSTRAATRARWCATTRSGTTSPASVPAAYEALLRAAQIAQTAPRGPVYVNLDAALQEAKIECAAAAARPGALCARALARQPAARARRAGGEAPVAARSAGHSRRARVRARWRRWKAARRARREAPGARAHRSQASAPPSRPIIRCTRAAPGVFLGRGRRAGDPRSRRHPVARLERPRRDAEAGLRREPGAGEGDPRLVRHAPAPRLEHGLPGAAADAMSTSCASPTRRCRCCSTPCSGAQARRRDRAAAPSFRPADGRAHSARRRASAERGDARRRSSAFTRLPLGWNGAYRHFRHPLDYLGHDGGGGVGAGPGLTVGAALALKGSGRMPVGIWATATS